MQNNIVVPSGDYGQQTPRLWLIGDRRVLKKEMFWLLDCNQLIFTRLNEFEMLNTTLKTVMRTCENSVNKTMSK